jgi:predicted metal-dependent hydrolase
MSETLQIEELQFTIVRSENRKTLGITVERDGTLTLRVPGTCSEDSMELFAREKLLWVYSKLTEKQYLQRTSHQREYVNGEGFYYLGRSYRLFIVEDAASSPALRLHRGQFHLRAEGRPAARKHFIDWYISRAQIWLFDRAQAYADRLNVQIARVTVQDLGYRWGSCSANNAINFHWRSILLPPPMIDYIIVHELAHLREPHHSRTFWTLIERILPDWQSRKRWLAERGAAYNL